LSQGATVTAEIVFGVLIEKKWFADLIGGIFKEYTLYKCLANIGLSSLITYVDGIILDHHLEFDVIF
jgi:hypothetical protein